MNCAIWGAIMQFSSVCQELQRRRDTFVHKFAKYVSVLYIPETYRSDEIDKLTHTITAVSD